MKKLLAVALTLALALGLVACGGQEEAEAPDLQTYYDDFMASLGEENAPMMMDITDDMIESVYPGLGSYELKQGVFKTAAISAVAFEMALVEVSDEADVEAVKGIFQSRIDGQIAGGAMYPATVEAWQSAQVLANGNVVALICAGEQQTAAVDAFNALFK
mgnify:FL=1